MSPAMLVAAPELVWVTGPSSPGLSTRIEIAILQPEQST